MTADAEPIQDDLWNLVVSQIQNERGTGEVKPPQTVLEWAERYRKIRGAPFTLDQFPPLKALYTDDHPHIVVMKPAQRGVSEWAINLACFALELGGRKWANLNGLNVGYIFPVQQALNDFSKERVSGLKEESLHMDQMFSDDAFDSLGFKRIGDSYLYLRGGWSEHGLLSFRADMLILDEYDRMNPAMISLARRRMNASPVRREVDISTPTLPGHGIHAAYLASDRRVYETPCPHCGTWQTFDFFRDVWCNDESYTVWRDWPLSQVDLATVTMHCPACHGEISDEQRCVEGRWKIEQPEMKRIHGYHIPWWPFTFVDLLAMVRSTLSDEPADVQELYRSDLGLPYEPGGATMTDDLIRQLSAWQQTTKKPTGPWSNTTLGADIGKRHHYRITSVGPDGNIYVRAMGNVESWDKLDQLMTIFQVRMAVIDALPELDASERFCQRWRGRALRAFYPTKNALKGELYRRPADSDRVQINRTMAMDRVYANIAGQRERWPTDITHDPEVLAHMKAPVRIRTTDAHGQEQYEWVHSSPDHLYHASVYDIVARDVLPKTSSAIPAVGGGRPLMQAYADAVGAREAPLASRHGRLPTYTRIPT